MKNLDLDSCGVQEINKIEMIEVNGGGSGSENGAYIAGRLLRACFPVITTIDLINKYC